MGLAQRRCGISLLIAPGTLMPLLHIRFIIDRPLKTKIKFTLTVILALREFEEHHLRSNYWWLRATRHLNQIDSGVDFDFASLQMCVSVHKEFLFSLMPP